MKTSNNQNFYPPGDSKVFFAAATAFVRHIKIGKKIIRLTSRDRGMTGTLESGYILIDQAHFAVEHRKNRKKKEG